MLTLKNNFNKLTHLVPPICHPPHFFKGSISNLPSFLGSGRPSSSSTPVLEMVKTGRFLDLQNDGKKSQDDVGKIMEDMVNIWLIYG